MRADRAFTVRAVSTFTPDRLYRVYVCGRQLAFIKIAGQAGVAEGVAAQFGLVGGLILAWWKKRARRNLQERLGAEDQQDIELLLTRDPKNFLMQPSEIVRSTIEPPARFGAHGAHVGSWKVDSVEGKKQTYQFEEVSEMREALTILPVLLGAVLTVQARWDESKRRYVKEASKDAA
jgi:hypothetical protein